MAITPGDDTDCKLGDSSKTAGILSQRPASPGITAFGAIELPDSVEDAHVLDKGRWHR